MAEKNGSDKTLQPNPLIAQLIAQGAETAMTVHGFVGPATRDGFICLYPRLLNRSDSIEIALADILHSVEAPQSVLGAVILWVKKDARIHIRRVGVSEAAIFPRKTSRDCAEGRQARDGRISLSCARGACACGCGRNKMYSRTTPS